MGASRTLQQAEADLARMVGVAHAVGWSVPPDHVTAPSRVATFRGMVIDTQSRQLSIPRARLERVARTVHHMLQPTVTPSIRELRSLLGKLRWMATVMLEGRLHCHTLQSLIPSWQANGARVRLSEEAHEDLQWWAQTLAAAATAPHGVWTPFWSDRDPVMCQVVSDAAAPEAGFAAIVEGQAYVGRWQTAAVAHTSSGWRELIPIYFAVRALAHSMAPGTVLVLQTDSTAVAYAINKGTSDSPEMRHLLLLIVRQAAHHQIHLVADWVRRDRIPLLDALSKLEFIVPRQVWPVL